MKQPLRIEITLSCKDKKRLKKVANFLIDYGFIGFEWNYTFRDTYEEYQLSVDIVGKEWLKKFYKLIK